MNKGDFISSIRCLWNHLAVANVGESYVCPTSLKPSDEFKVLSVSQEATYEELFLCGLRNSDYNIIMKDYAYLQFSFNADDELRYAYYPNPFIGTSAEAISELASLRELVNDGDIEYEFYLHQVAELRFSQHPPLVRYDSAPKQYVNLQHACSHFHFGHHSNNRWPVRRLMTPEAFGLIVLKHFYSAQWRSSPEITRNKNRLTLDKMYSIARSECQVLPSDLFSADEELQFHFV